MLHFKQIIYCILTILFFLALIWCHASFKHHQNNEGFVSLLIAGSLALLILFLEKRGGNKEKKALEKWKDNLKSNGIAVGVDYANCLVEEVKQTINYTRRDVPDRTLDTRLYRPDTLDEAPGIPRKRFSREGSKELEEKLFPDIMNQQFSYDHCVCIIRYSAMYMDNEITFVSKPVLMDKVSLEVQLALERKGIIYVNPNNLEDYYWDIEFLFM